MHACDRLRHNDNLTDKEIDDISMIFRSSTTLYSQNIAFRAVFDVLFPPGSMALQPANQFQCKTSYLVNSLGLLMMLIAQHYGSTERERTRFIETRNFLVASIVLDFYGKDIIEIGGLNVPVLLQIVKPKSYTVCLNREYAETFHKNHKETLCGFLSVDYYLNNFEDCTFNSSILGDDTIVYSSNTLEHIQDIERFMAKIYGLSRSVIAYLVFGPIHSHSFYGHHSSYDINELPLLNEEIDSFHLLPLRIQYRVAKNAFKRAGVCIDDIRIIEILSQSMYSSRQMLNNLTLSDYYRELSVSDLYIAKFEVFRDLHVQNKQSLRDAYKYNPNLGDTSARNVLAILTASPPSFRKKYPHLCSSVDPTLSHWLQKIDIS